MRPMLPLKEAARVLGYTPAGLATLVRKRLIRFCQVRKGGRILFRPEWLEEFVDQHTVLTARETPRPPRAQTAHQKLHDPAEFGLDRRRRTAPARPRR